jgi:hypothetical protein
LKIRFKLDVFFLNPTTSELSNYFQPTQNSEEPKDFCFYVLKDPSLRAVKNNLVEFQEGITVDKYGNVQEPWL